MGQNITKFVNDVIIDNDFRGDVCVEHRSNNTKRSFVFVNSLLGKHIPANPKSVLRMYKQVYKKILESPVFAHKNKRITVVGFAETATAFGHGVADYFAKDKYNVYYLQTTREKIPGANMLCEFQEEHSHATEQYLYGNIEKLKNSDVIVIIDDEISTGKTVLNMIDKFNELGINSKYIVASVCNWMTYEDQNRFIERDIDVAYIISGTLKDKKKKVECKTVKEDENFAGSDYSKVGSVTHFTGPNEKAISIFKSDRTGIDIDTHYLAIQDEMCEAVVKYIKSKLNTKLHNNILILGAEECMYLGIKVGEKLRNSDNNIDVKFHASSRSSIDIMEQSSWDTESIRLGAHLKNKSTLHSCYDKNRVVKIYNLAKYSHIFVIVDKEPTKEFRVDTEEALRKFGNNNNLSFIVVDNY